MTENGWRLEVASGARRELHRLPEKIAAAIVEFITTALLDNPLRVTKPLAGDLVAYRSARRGDYRVLVRVDEDERLVLVVRVAHRAHAYRPMTDHG
ncbi:type II toxin-antitoxin system RelE family toxin [Mumia sp. DW29H23]|uniref:type II toxin-antitoxin system RelE family toxin n=1 Tax=Mumia sp. DW29H23 TaxID=3421241 RepID=UPI003D68C450